MARIHPSIPLNGPLSAGDYRERDMLRLLEVGLPDDFDVFHNLPWTTVESGQQHFGELDLVVVAPQGHVVLLEVKAGEVTEGADTLSKHYGGGVEPKNIGHQVRRHHHALMLRIKSGELPSVNIQTLLVLPDHHIQSAILAYPRERIVDASQLDELCRLLMGMVPTTQPPDGTRQRVLDFLANRFQVVTDVSTHIQQVQHASTALSSGLATWVTKISHPSAVYVVQATAGSGKTQLALTLLKAAAAQGQRARYVCFNRPLADHLAQLAPIQSEVTTFHQLCREHWERLGHTPDFTQADVFDTMVQSLVNDEHPGEPTIDLLVVDESQDFETPWVEALIARTRPEGRIYILGDAGQQVYEREPFDIPDAVHIECMDNFRSPQRVVDVINTWSLTDVPVVARSSHRGQTPHILTWAPSQVNSLSALNQCLRNLWQAGYRPEQVAVISYRGVKSSEALKQAELGGHATRRFSHYDSAGNAIWTPGSLLVDSVYRFKGQSMPVVVLCEIDFEALTQREKNKLLVGLTRGQIRVDMVMSERSAQLLMP